MTRRERLELTAIIAILLFVFTVHAYKVGFEDGQKDAIRRAFGQWCEPLKKVGDE